MAEHIQLRIVTPQRQVLDKAVLEVTAPGTLGEFGVLPNHAAFLSSLEIGRLCYRDDAGLKRLAVRGGFAEVSDDVMTVLADDAVAAEQVDTERAEAQRSEAEAKLKTLSPLDPAYAEADGIRRWAEARIAAARGA